MQINLKNIVWSSLWFHVAYFFYLGKKYVNLSIFLSVSGTTKEYVYESCSDNEENDENKKTIANSETKEAPKPEKSPEPKKVIKQPTKQVSLTSFFKKK